MAYVFGVSMTVFVFSGETSCNWILKVIWYPGILKELKTSNKDLKEIHMDDEAAMDDKSSSVNFFYQ